MPNRRIAPWSHSSGAFTLGCTRNHHTLSKHTLVNRDRLIMADRDAVARLAVLLFDRIQMHANKEEQLLSLAAAFLLMSEAFGVPAQEGFTAVKNMMADPMRASGIYHQFDALRHYLTTNDFER